jgi:spore germination cell wall hydrolase CwlJ-like protein|tara:strand:+ start:2373 stop:2879 length:507 start_codon:yes stop_codon:yes gene_type:complete
MIANLPMYFLLIYISMSANIYNNDIAQELDDNREDLYCLVENIYYEARGESRRGKQAVAHVVLNRARSEQYPNTICDVVWQKDQFSWTTPGTVNVINLIDLKTRQYKMAEVNIFKDSIVAAVAAFIGETVDPTDGAMHYYAYKKIAPPAWSETAVNTVVIGNHKFLKF